MNECNEFVKIIFIRFDIVKPTMNGCIAAAHEHRSRDRPKRSFRAFAFLVLFSLVVLASIVAFLWVLLFTNLIYSTPWLPKNLHIAHDLWNFIASRAHHRSINRIKYHQYFDCQHQHFGILHQCCGCCCSPRIHKSRLAHMPNITLIPAVNGNDISDLAHAFLLNVSLGYPSPVTVTRRWIKLFASKLIGGVLWQE